MADYKNNHTPRKSFGGGGNRFGGPVQTYKAECSKCGSICELPFRPNGRKPVFCNNCFVKSDASERGPRREFSARPSFGADRPAPRPDQAFNDLKAELRVVNENLERLIRIMESSRTAPEEPQVTKAPAKKRASKKV